MSHQLVKSLVAASAIAVVASNVYAGSISEIKPFAGIDGVYTHTKGKGDFNKFLPRNYPGVNLYVGGKVCEKVGLELGWDSTKRKTNSTTLGAGEKVFGIATAAGNYSTSVKMNSVHLDVNGYYPVANKLELLASVGIGLVKPKFTATFNGAPMALTSKSKSVLRLRAGAQYMATDTIGVRGLVGWANTSRIQVNGLSNFLTPTAPNRPFKNSIFGTVGLFVKF